MSKKDYFFSFSLNGKNQGCINTTADSKADAWLHIMTLKIAPNADHIRAYEINEIGAEGLENDKLYTPEELTALGYRRDNS